MECRLISAEISQFKPTWLNVREHQNSAPRGCFAVLGIDPVPPPSERQMARGLQGKDWEAHYVWGRHNGEYHLLDYARNRGHEPSWSVATALALAHRWKVARIVVEVVAYQRTLKWLLEQEMRRRRVYFSVVPLDSRMQKFARIVNVLSVVWLRLGSSGLVPSIRYSRSSLRRMVLHMGAMMMILDASRDSLRRSSKSLSRTNE